MLSEGFICPLKNHLKMSSHKRSPDYDTTLLPNYVYVDVALLLKDVLSEAWIFTVFLKLLSWENHKIALF